MPIVGMIVLVLDIVTLMDIFKSSMEMTNKLLWAILVLVFPVLGIIIYYAFGRNNQAKPKV